jgi:hypothetical protein
VTGSDENIAAALKAFVDQAQDAAPANYRHPTSNRMISEEGRERLDRQSRWDSQ